MAYLILQMLLYMLCALLLGVLLGWGLWGRQDGALKAELKTAKAEQEPLRAEVERLKTSLEACGRAYAELEKSRRPATAEVAVVTELEPVNLLSTPGDDDAPKIIEHEPAVDLIEAEAVEVAPEVEPVTVDAPEPEAAKPASKAAKAKRRMPAARIDPVMEPEDLSRILGIGPENAKRLHAAHVSTFAQIANWNADDVERIEDILGFHGRVHRERWIEQARLLAAGDEEEFARLFPTASHATNS
jgi:predicted flap endonuclease-1-like 5' DNA nuclease